MKRLFRLPVLLYVLVAGIAVTQVACTNADQKEAKQESEEAYADFKDYVNTAGEKIDTAMSDAERDWDNEMAENRAAYKEREDRVMKHMDTYDEKRQQEINEIKTRYSENWDRQEMAYERYTTSNKFRNTVYGVEVKGNDMGTITAANIRQVFDNFVNTVQANQANYTMEDWRNLETYWEALQDREDELADQLSANDKQEITKARTKYAAIKNKNKINIKAGNTGTDLKETGKDTRTNVNEAADKTGSKIGNTAKKVGSEIKETTKKGVDKIQD